VDIRPALSGSAALVVGDEHTAARAGSGKVRVLAILACACAPPESHGWRKKTAKNSTIPIAG
jgi:hypothetical protein